MKLEGGVQVPRGHKKRKARGRGGHWGGGDERGNGLLDSPLERVDGDRRKKGKRKDRQRVVIQGRKRREGGRLQEKSCVQPLHIDMWGERPGPERVFGFFE